MQFVRVFYRMVTCRVSVRRLYFGTLVLTNEIIITECLKVMDDYLHQLILVSNKLFVAPQGKQLWSWNKDKICPTRDKAAATTLRPPCCHESQSMTAIVTISHVILAHYPSLSYRVLNLLGASAGISSPVHRAFTEGKLYKRISFTPSIMPDQTVNKTLFDGGGRQSYTDSSTAQMSE